MINLSSKTRTRITRNIEVTLSGDELRGLVNAYFTMSKGVEAPIPTDATITVHVPGGGDWSNEDLDITENHPVVISWTEEDGNES